MKTGGCHGEERGRLKLSGFSAWSIGKGEYKEMIFYFSATGNSKHVAMSLAKEDERVILITDCISEKNFSFDVSKEECVGIISPTYNWTMPNLVSGFLRHLELKYDKKPYIYYVGTFGTTTGAAAVMANKLLEQKGISFDAFYDVKMPDTWTPIFDLSDKNKVAKINENAAVQIRSIKKHIDNRFKGKYMHITTPYVTGLIGKKYMIIIPERPLTCPSMMTA